MYQNLLFDLDGTLTDPKEGITKCFQYALKCCGVEEDLENLNRVIGPPLIDSFMEYYGFDREKGLYGVEKYRERFTDIGICENALFPGIKELLRDLKKDGRKIALATAKPMVFSERILKHFEIEEYFDVTVGSGLDDTLNYKEEIITEVLKQLDNPSKETVLMIGDRRQDIEGAKKVGVASLGVRFGYAEEGELEQAGADYTVDTIEDLRKFLLD